MDVAGQTQCVVVAGPGRDGHQGVARLVAAMLRRASLTAGFGGVARDGAHAAAIARRHGAEVVGVSVLAGGSVTALAHTIVRLRAAGVRHVFVVVSGHVTPSRRTRLATLGVPVFGPDESTDAVCRHVRAAIGAWRPVALAV